MIQLFPAPRFVRCPFIWKWRLRFNVNISVISFIVTNLPSAFKCLSVLISRWICLLSVSRSERVRGLFPLKDCVRSAGLKWNMLSVLVITRHRHFTCCSNRKRGSNCLCSNLVQVQVTKKHLNVCNPPQHQRSLVARVEAPCISLFESPASWSRCP